MIKNFDDSEKARWWPLLTIFGVILLWILTIIVLPMFFPDISERGQFGDSFGAINALFSGLAFAGAIWAILMKKKELALQRKFEKTLGEIKEQKETHQKRSFESSFFQLLDKHNEIVNSMQIQDKACSGRECFGYMLREFRNTYDRYKGAEEKFWAGMAKNPDEARQLMRGWANDKYEQLFDQYRPYVGHYFQHLYNVVKFVDQNDFPEDYETKKFYTNVIRAQLSSNELGLLFYDGLSDRGAKFKVLVEKYALFEDIPSKVLINADHRVLYDESAYLETRPKIYVTPRGGVYVKPDELLASPKVREMIKKMAAIPFEHKSSGTSPKNPK